MFSFFVQKYFDQWRSDQSFQEEKHFAIVLDILKKNKDTQRGKKFGFEGIKNYQDFSKYLPCVTYEMIANDIQRMMQGEKDVLISGLPPYFAQTAGTSTGNAKYLPVTHDALQKNHLLGGKACIANYLHNNPGSKLFSGKSLILGGGFTQNIFGGETPTGYISAILHKESGLLGNWYKTPSSKILFHHDREEKIQKILEICVKQNVTSMGGVTSWALVLLDKIMQSQGIESVHAIWPNFALYLSGGMNFEPYRAYFEKFFPNKNTQFYQVYNASEGFFASQWTNESTDMILHTNHGVFFECVDMDSYFESSKRVVPLSEVMIGKQYALVITTYAGLYRYEIGDVIVFTHKEPFLIQIVGRTKQYLDVFSEHVFVDNTDRALQDTAQYFGVICPEYHVAPIFPNEQGQGGHERIIECDSIPKHQKQFIEYLDQILQRYNSYYAGKRFGSLMMQMPVVHFIPKGGFLKRLTYKGKVGGQHKVPKLSQTRSILQDFIDIGIIQS